MSLRPSLLCPLGPSLSLSLSVVCSPHSPQLAPAPAPAHAVSRPCARRSPFRRHLSLLRLSGLPSPSPGPLCAHPSPPTPFLGPALSWSFPLRLPVCCALTPCPTARPLTPSPWASLLPFRGCAGEDTTSMASCELVRAPQMARTSSADPHCSFVRTHARTHVGPVLSSPEARRFEAPRAVNE